MEGIKWGTGGGAEGSAAETPMAHERQERTWEEHASLAHQTLYMVNGQVGEDGERKWRGVDPEEIRRLEERT